MEDRESTGGSERNRLAAEARMQIRGFRSEMERELDKFFTILSMLSILSFRLSFLFSRREISIISWTLARK